MEQGFLRWQKAENAFNGLESGLKADCMIYQMESYYFTDGATDVNIIFHGFCPRQPQ